MTLSDRQSSESQGPTKSERTTHARDVEEKAEVQPVKHVPEIFRVWFPSPAWDFPNLSRHSMNNMPNGLLRTYHVRTSIISPT